MNARAAVDVDKQATPTRKRPGDDAARRAGGKSETDGGVPSRDVRFAFGSIDVEPPVSKALSVSAAGEPALGRKDDPRSAMTEGVKRLSASGHPRVSFKYTPEAADKSTKIVFIQVMRELADGTPVKPSKLSAKFNYQDADTTSDFYHVDYTAGERDPYYNGDDKGNDLGVQGNAISTPKRDATMHDEPKYSDGSFPPAVSTVEYEFRTIAFSAAGLDKGKFYEYHKWTYAKTKGKPSTVWHQGNSTDTSLPKSKAAINLFCKNKGFALPKHTGK